MTSNPVPSVYRAHICFLLSRRHLIHVILSPPQIQCLQNRIVSQTMSIFFLAHQRLSNDILILLVTDHNNFELSLAFISLSFLATQSLKSFHFSVVLFFPNHPSFILFLLTWSGTHGFMPRLLKLPSN